VSVSGSHPLSRNRYFRPVLLLVLAICLGAVAWAEPGTGEGEGEAVAPSSRTPAVDASSRFIGASDPERRPIAPYGAPRASTPSDDPRTLAGTVAVRLGLVLALVVACAVAWRRLQAAMPQPAMEESDGVQLLGTVALAPQRMVHLVSVGSHRLLLGSSPQQVSLLAHLEGGAGPPVAAVRGVRFAGRGESGGSSDAEQQAHALTAHRAPRTAHASGASEEPFENLVAWVRAIDLREGDREEGELALGPDAPPIGVPQPQSATPPARRGRWLVESARGSHYEVATESQPVGNGDVEPGPRSLFRVLPGAGPEGRDG
jgi:flagellar biogenesis protein FliO